ncbi:glycoside hydrolase family 88/105 protein [Chondrinema litorale]|uniref:glycoside hydrolase family 88/105 protein n=1 Tax=Chondrinema litorale TaxID=2994555 RepID=UPI002543260D|nr:glycoside hydrolase family 88 protein [Chondrinema litorale]UZR98896.1 glycoside hydrolase family 88 protein [Chondrinema litorale]
MLYFLCSSSFAFAQEPKMNDSNTPLHLLQPNYPTPYTISSPEQVEAVINKVYTYLNANTPTKVVDEKSGKEITDFSKPNDKAILAKGDFRLLSYEWGVTYAGMLAASKATGKDAYAEYVNNRVSFIADMANKYRKLKEQYPEAKTPFRSVLEPHALDDAGAICAAIIKAKRNGLDADVQPVIDNYIDYISNKQFRLFDGTLARNRPLPNTLWLDDLFMSVPALAQMGKLTGDRKYFDDAVKQVVQFSERMFNEDKNLYMHGWVQDMGVHPQFHWARANGWAVMTKVELLDVLPEDHPGREKVMDLLKKHIYGLASYQDGTGFWHQLIDRNDSYLETSATAIYTYAIAKAINNGWIDEKAYGSMALLAWNAVVSKVNDEGQVEGTCVGTGMGFDPAFYYHRPINIYAAHGYGPVLLAGAEIINLLNNKKAEINDSAILFSENN